jgi:cell division septation protein DedD
MPRREPHKRPRCAHVFSPTTPTALGLGALRETTGGTPNPVDVPQAVSSALSDTPDARAQFWASLAAGCRGQVSQNRVRSTVSHVYPATETPRPRVDRSPINTQSGNCVRQYRGDWNGSSA